MNGLNPKILSYLIKVHNLINMFPNTLACENKNVFEEFTLFGIVFVQKKLYVMMHIILSLLLSLKV